MKVLLVNLWRVIESKGGAEKVLFSMANALAEKGNTVSILALDNTPGAPFFHVDKKVKFINAGVGYVEKKTILYRIKRALHGSRKRRCLYDECLFDQQKAEALKPAIENENPDIIISYNVDATRILINILEVNTPVITMFHFDPDTILMNITSSTKKALEKSAAIQVLLPSHVETTKKYVKNDKIIYIPNIAPQYSIDASAKRLDKIVNVARFDRKQKRQHLLIEAFNLIKDDIPESWKIEFWGETSFDSKYYEYCQKLVKKYSLEQRIVFCGTTNNIREVLVESKIFVFPSAWEGFSLAMLEAMSAGLPVIGYKNCQSVNELITNNENGLLCEDGVKSLASAIAVLIKEPDLQQKMGKKAKASVFQYNADNVWLMWEQLIKKVYAIHTNSPVDIQ